MPSRNDRRNDTVDGKMTATTASMFTQSLPGSVIIMAVI
jgi:hypothetical protein